MRAYPPAPQKKVLILGAGLAGLSTGYHLKERTDIRAIILEKSDRVGGTARSVHVDGFTFDFTGHLLHLHDPYTKKLIRQLLRNNLILCDRKAAIYANRKLTPYPFQAHTYGLPKNIVQECVEGFKDAVKKYADPATRPTSLPFSQWSRRTFGEGIYRHFMKPYNEKLWQVNLDEMTAEWCGMFVPQPKLEDVVRGSKANTEKSFGYNVQFLYPKKGGIQVLPEALAKGLEVRVDTPFERVHWQEKKILLSDGSWMYYDRLVSTLPLLELLNRTEDPPKEIRALIPNMRCTSVICINLGINRPKISNRSWIYFPEKKYIFYRVGFPMNFTPHAVPRGTSSMYVEVSHPIGHGLSMTKDQLLNRVRRDLEDCQILKKSDKILVSNIVPIRYAYVIYTPDRKALMQKVLSFLHSNSIDSIGRYGEWKYSFMEEAILDGKKTAEKILAEL